MPTVAEALAHGWNLHQQGRWQEAETWYRRTLDAAPRDANAWCYLGMVLHDQRRFDQAEQAYMTALALQSPFPVARNNLANTLGALGRLDEAESTCRQAIAEKPDYARAFANLGAILTKQNRPADAEAAIRRAVELSPNDPFILRNHGAALLACDRAGEALDPIVRAAAISATPETIRDLGTAYLRLGRPDDALAQYDEAIRRNPQFVDAHYARSLVRLLQGDMPRGWDEYEWRWRRDGFAPPLAHLPPWDGEELAGRTVMLTSEQGLGDTLHFVRYASFVRQRGGRSILRAPKKLTHIIATCRWLDEVITLDDPLPLCDFHLPLLSLPRVARTTLDTIPCEVPYLSPDPNLVALWRAALAPHGEVRRIGIAWQGSRTHQADAQRSIPLAEFAPLAEVPDVQLFSLQKGDGREQIAECRDRLRIIDLGDKLDEATGPFLDTAAVVTQLDLVICCDTALGHMAGALAAPVWLALPFSPDWRWLVDRADTPWYPTMRLFRQPVPGDWSSVFRAMAAALRIESQMV